MIVASESPQSRVKEANKKAGKEKREVKTLNQFDGLFVFWGDSGFVGLKLDDVGLTALVLLDSGLSGHKDASSCREGRCRGAAVGDVGEGKVAILGDDERLLKTAIATTVRAAKACKEENEREENVSRRAWVANKTKRGERTRNLGRDNRKKKGKEKEFEHHGFN